MSTPFLHLISIPGADYTTLLTIQGQRVTPTPTNGQGSSGRRDEGELLNLEPLCLWCGELLQRAVDSTWEPSDCVAPPLPQHLRDPLAKNGFDVFDETAMALALAPDLDPMLALAIAALTGMAESRYLTVSALADLIGAAGPERVALAARLSHEGPLVRTGLIHVVPPLDAPVVGSPPRGPSFLASCVASTALLRWLFGVTRLESGLFPLVRDDLIAPTAPPDSRCAEALIAQLESGLPSSSALSGDHPSDALATALYAVSRCGRPALTVDAVALVESPSAARVTAEALLRDAVVIVTGDTIAVPPSRWESFSNTVILGALPTSIDDGSRSVTSLTVRPQSTTSVGCHLVDVLRSRGLSVSNAEAGRIGRWTHLRYEDVPQLAGNLAAHAAGVGSDQVTASDVTSVSVAVNGRDFSRLATPLETSQDWTHLVLPDHLRRDLTEFVQQAADRTKMLDESGFSELPGQSRGVTAVFAGPSGTGKTMAARLVAGELGLPLYAVNLAATVSKYIGETERNLDAVFAAAERTDAVVLFDEAESLFGKRSEIQDARDRYANLEISFLLQRMERYDGVAILATNLLGYFDDAFARRLSFCLHFPFPNELQRASIWKAVWPPQVPLAEDLSFDELASRHALSGGHIRNIALAATHLARMRDGVVDRACVSRAIEREYAKLGQPFADLGEVYT